MRGWGRVGLIAAGLPAALLVVVLLPNLLAPAYRYPPARPFHGSVWYNPYAGMSGRWQQASLHTHGLTCCSSTKERLTDQQMVDYYRALGYDVALVSDHQRIAAIDVLPSYEHGMNVRKTHQLVIGARRVDWLDFLLYQSADNKQYVLDRLHAAAPVVVLAHPEIRNGYSFSDLARLTDYDGMEVLHDGDDFERWWDAALSAGRFSFATGSDDAHFTAGLGRRGRSWTMIGAQTTRPADLLRALEHGWTYAANGRQGRNGIRLRGVQVRADTLIVTTDVPGRRFAFIGQGGAVRAVVSGTDRATYLLRDADAYIRTVIEGPGTTLYVNPVVRTSEGAVERLGAIPTHAAWPRVTGIAATLVGLAWGVRRRARSPASDPIPALPVATSPEA